MQTVISAQTLNESLQFMAEELKAAHLAKAIVSAQLHDAQAEIGRLNARIKELETASKESPKASK